MLVADLQEKRGALCCPKKFMQFFHSQQESLKVNKLLKCEKKNQDTFKNLPSIKNPHLLPTYPHETLV